MRTSIQITHVDSKEVYFFFDQYHQPSIEIDDKKYTSLNLLFQDYHFLLQPKYIQKAAQIANFLLKGLEFIFIENVEEFKEDYQQRIESEQSSFDTGLVRLSDYGIYNVSTMHTPRIEDNKLVFFVKHDYNQLPYKVSVYINATEEAVQADYELLPTL